MRLTLVLAILFCSSLANANVGIPVVSFGLPFMAINLVLVVLIESAVVKYLGDNLRFMTVARGVFAANAFTTLIGYPVVAVLEALSAVFGSTYGWLLPFSDLEHMNLYVSTFMFLTLIPSYLLSGWIESRWLRHFQISSKAVWLANTASYVFLTIQVYLLPPNLLVGLGRYTFESSYVVIMRILGLH